MEDMSMSKYPNFEKGNMRIEFVNIGEGYNGDYDPSDPEDANLVRFDAYTKREDCDKWEAYAFASYCTGLTVDDDLETAARVMVNALCNTKSVDEAKTLAEELSWLTGEDIQNGGDGKSDWETNFNRIIDKN